jgi:hypothetical protein
MSKITHHLRQKGNMAVVKVCYQGATSVFNRLELDMWARQVHMRRKASNCSLRARKDTPRDMATPDSGAETSLFLGCLHWKTAVEGFWHMPEILSVECGRRALVTIQVNTRKE